MVGPCGAVFPHLFQVEQCLTIRKGVQDFNEPNSVSAAQSAAQSHQVETVERVWLLIHTNPCICFSFFVESKDGAIVFLSMLFMLVLYLVVSPACFLNFEETMVWVTRLASFFSAFLEVQEFATKYTGRL